MQLLGHNKSFCQLESMSSSSSLSKNVIHGKKRCHEKSSKSEVDNNRVQEDEIDVIYSGNQAEDTKEDVDHEEQSKSATYFTGVIDSAGTKFEYESIDNGINQCIGDKGGC